MPLHCHYWSRRTERSTRVGSTLRRLQTVDVLHGKCTLSDIGNSSSSTHYATCNPPFSILITYLDYMEYVRSNRSYELSSEKVAIIACLICKLISSSLALYCCKVLWTGSQVVPSSSSIVTSSSSVSALAMCTIKDSQYSNSTHAKSRSSPSNFRKAPIC